MAGGARNDCSAGETSQKIKHIIEAISYRGEIDPEIPRWLALHPKLAEKLAKVGLVSAPAKSATTNGTKLVTFIDGYIATRTDVKPNTVRTWKQTRGLLIEHFSDRQKVAGINELDAQGFHAWLSSVKDPESNNRRFSSATVTKYTSCARQFLAAAVDGRLIAANPFRGIKLGKKTNKGRQRFIDRELIGRVLDGCKDPEFKLVIALSRYGGLRIPSELDGLLWQHIDRERGRILITSPKTERYEGGGSREIPLFPELAPYIDAWWEKCPEGCEHVISSNRQTEAAWRTRMHKLLHKLGITAWPRIFHNLRAARQTELESDFPTHVVCDWLGNNENTAREHYLQTTDDDFLAALNSSDANEKRRAFRRAHGQKSTEIDRKRFPKTAKSPRNSGISQKSAGVDGNRTHLAPLQTPRRV